MNITVTTYLKRALLVLNLLPAMVHAQEKPSVLVGGEVLRPLTLSVAGMAAFPQAEFTAKDREGKDRRFRGVWLADVLDSAGVTLGQALRGEHMAKYVLAKATDDYAVVFALPEVDPAFGHDRILLAYSADGKPLPAGEGPFRLIVPGDKRPARWIRQLISIQVLFSKE